MTKKHIQGEKPRIRMTDKHIPAVRAIGTIDSRAKFFRKKLTEASLPPPCGIASMEILPSRPAAEAVGVKSRVRSVFNTPTIIQEVDIYLYPDANVFPLCLPANERKNLHLAGKQPDSVVSYPYYNAPTGVSNNSGLLAIR